MRWTFKPKPDQGIVKHLQETLNLDPIAASLLAQRGVENYEEARLFFKPTLDDLHDPFLMKDMDKAVGRIARAIENQERILVFGDYDVDGTTAVAAMSSYLKTLTPHVDTYIPDRYNEGYGVSYQGIDYADDNGCALIVALDCGVKSVDHVAYASAKNIDFVICDHHLPGETLPDAVAVLDPKRSDCDYPYDELCGCGIGFKLIQALGRNRGQNAGDLTEYLDLVATAIAADIVPMTGENRILAKFGLDVINTAPRPGIKALVGSVKKKQLDITDVVFVVAPRINAAGRIKHGDHAVKLLTEFDIEQAQQVAKDIEQYNVDRKDLDKQITQQALAQIERHAEQDRYTTVVFQKDWHKGVIGIVASRLIETYYRPTLVFTQSGDKYAASARSVKDFDVYNALQACAEHLEQFGGHMYAAGMTLKPENYTNFKQAFERVVKETMPEHLRTPEVLIDAEIAFDQITPKLIRILKQFEPFGPQNMTPVFVSSGLIDTGYAKTLGKDNEHLRLFVKQADSQGVAAIGFGLGDKMALVKNQKPFEAAFCIDENEWNGSVTTQLRLKDLR